MSIAAIKPKNFRWYDASRYAFSLGLIAGQNAYLAGHTASEMDPDSKKIVVRGGMTDQAHTAYQKVGVILEAAGLDFSNVVRVVEYVRADSLERYAELAAARAAAFGSHQPTINTVTVQSLLRRDALVELEVIASMTPLGKEAGAYGARESDGVVYLPSVQPIDDAGNIIGAGDLVAQTNAVFDKARRMLSALGLGFDSVVKTVDYISPAARPNYRKSGAVRKDHLGPVYPAAAGIVMPRLLHKDALIQYDFTATRDKPVMINPGWARYNALTYSPAVKAGKYVFMSGQGALEPETEKMLFVGDVVAQSDYIYRNILKVLEAAGGRPEHLVKTIEYVAPPALGRYREVADVRRSLMRRPLPVSTGVVCEALLLRDMLLEVVPLAILS